MNLNAISDGRLLTTTVATAYTCPANTTAYFKLLQASNVGAADDNLTVLLHKSTGSNYRLLKDAPCPKGNAVGVISGTLVLRPGDSIQASCTTPNAVELVWSALEVS